MNASIRNPNLLSWPLYRRLKSVLKKELAQARKLKIRSRLSTKTSPESANNRPRYA